MKWDKILIKEFLIEELITKGKAIRFLQKELNVSTATILKYCKRTGMYEQLKKEVPRSRFNDLTGRNFGKLTVIRQGTSDRFNKIRWICKCTCGREKLINATSLLAKLTKSCGFCARDNFKGYEEISGAFWRKLERKAIERRLDFVFTITPKYVWEIYLKQNKCCALSGIPLIFKRNNDRANEQTASIDRIDSKRGYEKGNIQIIHKRLNLVKNVLPNDEFLMWCKTIYLYNKSKADKLDIELSTIGWWDK